MKTWEDILASAFHAGFNYAEGIDVTDQQWVDPESDQIFDEDAANKAFDKWRHWWATGNVDGVIDDGTRAPAVAHSASC